MNNSNLNISRKTIIQNILCFIIVVLVFIYMYSSWKERNDSLKEVVFVKVKIKEVELGNKGGPLFLFNYHLNDTAYKGNYTLINSSELAQTKHLKEFVGDYFYVKVSRKKPKYNELLIDYSVVDTTLIQPKSGWKELPEKIKSKYINQNSDFFSGT